MRYREGIGVYLYVCGCVIVNDWCGDWEFGVNSNRKVCGMGKNGCTPMRGYCLSIFLESLAAFKDELKHMRNNAMMCIVTSLR